MTNTLTIADVHGQADALQDILHKYANQGHNLVFLGDYIDRSNTEDGDIRTLNLVRAHYEEPLSFGYRSCVVLRGNHEQLLLDAIDTEDYELWEVNGGAGYALPLLKQHYHWLNSLPYYHTSGEYLFVHAGVRPNVPLEEQTTEDMIWIRGPFLKAKHHGLPYTVVHGHTIQENFEVNHYPGRIACDTGSFLSGKVGHTLLTC